MSIPRRHHYVPQVYLQRWEDSKKLLWIYDLQNKTVSHRNKRRVLFEDYLYSITLREFNLLTIHCIFAAPGYRFLTSDNPVCIRPIFIENLNFVGVFWFPISPYTLVSLSEKNRCSVLNRALNISHYLITGESVQMFNKHICENAANIIVSSALIEDPRFKFLKN